MFVRLGLLNSSRHLGRSLLVVLTMALAAVSLTSALSFSKGIMPNSNRFYRNFLGGDILAVPLRWAGHQGIDTALELRRLPENGLSWLEALYPELYSEGYPSLKGANQTAFTRADLSNLREYPGITAVNSVPLMPASLHSQKDGVNYELQVRLCPAPDTGLLPAHLAAMLNEGEDIAIKNKFIRFDEQKVAQLVSAMPDEAVVDEDEYLYPTNQDILLRKQRIAREQLADALKLPESDDLVRLAVPSFRISGNQVLTPDYSRQISSDMIIKAEAAIPTREIIFFDSHGARSGEQGFLHLPLVWVSKAKWNELWQQAAGGAPYPYTTLALQVADLSRLEDTVLSLQQAFPDFTFQSVTRLASVAETRGLLDFFYTAPEPMWRPSTDAAISLPVSLGRSLALLMYLVAGMFIASRMVTGAAARRKEIGVLKALGARRRDIVSMALSEAFLVAFVGNTLGFLIVKGAGVIMELSNKAPLWRILNGVASEYWLVTGVAVATSLVFALVPAVQMANLTVMEVLRHE